MLTTSKQSSRCPTWFLTEDAQKFSTGQHGSFNLISLPGKEVSNQGLTCLCVLSPWGKVLKAFVGPPYYNARKFSCVLQSHTSTPYWITLSQLFTLLHPNIWSPAWRERRKEGTSRGKLCQGHAKMNRN